MTMRLVNGYKGLRTYGILFAPQHILRLMKLRKFPACRKVGNVCLWLEDDILQWVRNLPTPATLPERE